MHDTCHPTVCTMCFETWYACPLCRTFVTGATIALRRVAL
jgi:hypothetical protein